jgi:hypothetical protein
VKFRVLSASALLLACVSHGSLLFAQSPVSAAVPGTTGKCTLQVYPGAALHSVGEDFDAVHTVDQDLHDYYKNAGRSLDWLTPSRQSELLRQVPFTAFVGDASDGATIHDQPVSRSDALQAHTQTEASGCHIEAFIPQLLLERGGLATRSLRVFGVVWRYERGSAVQTFSGYASGEMTGFRLRTPADVSSATHLVEAAYVEAVSNMLRNFNKSSK